MEGKERRPGVMSAAEVTRLLQREFPQMASAEHRNVIEEAWHCGARVRRTFSEKSLRPGGTISVPTMMGLTDFAMYVAILASIGPVPLAVTTNLNINFLRKPSRRDLIAEVKLIKLGKRLAVGDVAIYSDGEENMVAHATSTYSIPPPEGWS
jgi:acyl-coenzyme A thioesterase PaaI-like protein